MIFVYFYYFLKKIKSGGRFKVSLTDFLGKKKQSACFIFKKKAYELPKNIFLLKRDVKRKPGLGEIFKVCPRNSWAKKHNCGCLKNPSSKRTNELPKNIFFIKRPAERKFGPVRGVGVKISSWTPRDFWVKKNHTYGSLKIHFKNRTYSYQAPQN